MASLFRYVAAFALLQSACSSGSEGGDVPGAFGGGFAAPPIGAGANGGASTAGAGGGSGGAGPSMGGTSSTGDMQPPNMLGTGGSPPLSGTGGSASGAGGTGSTGPAPVPVESGLPPRGAGGVPQPSGAPGNLRVLDWAGFRAAMSYTFDDSNRSQIVNYPALAALGVRMTFYLQTGKVAESSDAVWEQALAAGHELGNHTQSHQSTGANIAGDTDAATNFIENNFDTTVYTMAAPNGSPAYGDVARTRFLINRGVTDRLIAPNDNTDPFNLSCFYPNTNAPVGDLNAKVDAARAAGAWQVVLVHGFNGNVQDFAFQPIDLPVFVQSVNYAKSLGDLWIDSLVNVAAYWRGQKTFTSTTPAVNGANTTWTWTLPDHFPPRRFLRVSVSGGTLSQGGVPLAWDEHGYYEVALDVGSLTLSP
jgi:peptidoglycan/xylan/chitin deacetylase (PgdA/CDA1 family)